MTAALVLFVLSFPMAAGQQALDLGGSPKDPLKQTPGKVVVLVFRSNGLSDFESLCSAPSGNEREIRKRGRFLAGLSRQKRIAGKHSFLLAGIQLQVAGFAR